MVKKGRKKPVGPPRARSAARTRRRRAPSRPRASRTPRGVAPAVLRDALKRQVESAGVPRWNPSPADVQQSVARLVLTLAEFIRRLLERQAIRRMEEGTLTAREVEDVGLALMRLEAALRDVAAQFDLALEDLNLDLGPAGRLM